MWITGLLIGSAIVLFVWLFIVRPMDRRYHDEKLKIIQKRIQEREKKLAEKNQS